MKEWAPKSVYKLPSFHCLASKLQMHKEDSKKKKSTDSNIHKAKRAEQKITIAVYDRGDRDWIFSPSRSERFSENDSFSTETPEAYV